MAIEQEKRPYKHQILFDKRNFKFVGIGLGLMVLGFLLMMGGKTTDPNVYNPDELYSFRRITLAPILIIAGLIVQIYAILLKPNPVVEKLEDTLSQKEEEAKKAAVLNKMYQTGEKCKEAGTYHCKLHQETSINLSKGNKFPECKKKGGHKASWILVQKAL